MAITGKNTSQDYGYTGGIQSFTAPFTGLYKFEVWGASGNKASYGNFNSYGYGGYVYGYKVLNKGQVLYIGVGGMGGQGSNAAFGAGGYNGGGTGGGYSGLYGSGGGGGGATHISTVNGVLSSAYGGALIVAGGGGGTGLQGNGGGGGGISSLNGILPAVNSHNPSWSSPTPTSAGWYKPSSTYYSKRGQGFIGYPNSGYTSNCYGCGGGGGGMYGGVTSYESGGTGGSGYVGGVPAVTFNGATYNNGYGGSRNGNGYARITFIDIPSNLFVDGTQVGKVYFNGTEVTKVIYNGTTVFG